MAGNSDYVMVAAIDFGTTFSGYAFSFTNSPEEIRMNKNWGESLGFQSYKTPTSVLVNPHGEFEAFGFEAENQYCEIVEDSDTDESMWNIFRHFKMILHKKQEVSRKNSVCSSSGEIRTAMSIFVMALRYLKQHLIDNVSRQVATKPDASMIRWVITVPAIWSDESKQFMREAAYKAGLMKSEDSKQLVIALEPEAASLHCRRLDVTQFVDQEEMVSFRAGTKYLVIDSGGGTVDVTAHEILTNGDVKELLAATGGPWGGTKVDANFVSLLCKVLGAHFIDIYKAQCPQQWLGFMTTFEKMKKSAKPNGKANLNVPLSWSMGSKYTEITNGKSIERTINTDGADYGVAFTNGSLVINHKALKELFKPVIDGILSHIQDLLSNIKLHPCKYFFLVGGFSESAILQEAIKDKFAGQVEVLIPSEAQMSVIKGAVLFGHNPGEINTRVARRTYGYGTTKKFDAAFHKEDKRVRYEGGDKCTDLFGVLVKKDAEVPIGTEKLIKFRPISSRQKEAKFDFYSIERQPTEPSQYIDDIDVEKLGGVTIDIPDTSDGLNRELHLKVIFGGTEIQVEATDTKTGYTTATSLNLLTK